MPNVSREILQEQDSSVSFKKREVASPSNVESRASTISVIPEDLIRDLILSTGNRLYIGWFGILMFPLLSLVIIAYVLGFIFAPPVDIDGISVPVAGSLLYGNNLITGGVIPSSNATGVQLVFISIQFGSH